ncbi:MAG: NADH-quinone oxidoreductase subunit H [Magnetococcales bacterium]|nr:NADH-quinone oxidoreductase subunit H [Magnetococcales bacterium]
MELMHDLLLQGWQMVLVVLIAPWITGVVRKTKARMLRKQGPSVLQPYRDLRRLLSKETLLAENASWLFRVAPYLIVSATWVAATLVPTFATGLPFSWVADLLAIVAILATARFFLALAGMDVGTSFGGIGSSREMMIASLAEPAMLFIVFTMAILAGTTRLSTIASVMASGTMGIRVSIGLSLFAMLIVALAENARIPVDNPATHLELTMVHEAMVLEYTGRHLAMIEIAASIKLVLFLSLISCLFFPLGMAQREDGWLAMGIGLVAYLLKINALACLLAIGESVMAKMRVFRVAELLSIAMLFGVLAVFLLFLSRGM